MPMLFDERGTRHIRIWEEAHPHLGRDAPVSGPRNDRIWDLKRPHLGLETVERETAFADK